MNKSTVCVLLVSITVSTVPFLHASWLDAISQAAGQFRVGFEESTQQEIERRSGTIMNRARQFLTRWLPGDRDIEDENGFVTAGRGVGHIVGYPCAWLLAVDQTTDAEQFRAMVLRCTGFFAGLYVLRKLASSGEKKVINVS